MAAPKTHDGETMDRKMSLSICDAVGERLQQFLRPHQMGPSPHIERLIEELRRREGEGGMSVGPSGRGRPRFFR